MAFDYGNKRIGIAVTDPLKIIASALDTIHPKDIFEFIKKYLEKEQVELFVVGMPVNLKNEATDVTAQVVGFVRKLQKEYANIPVKTVDERFTSVLAHRTMRESGINKKHRQEKGVSDRISATIILQSYMESLEFRV